MNSNPKITVCVPNYNYARYVGRTIESVLEQTYENFELLVVDDASEDNSIDVVSRYKDPRIRLVVNKTNLGRLENINHCLKLATGDYVTVLPADCYLPATSLEDRVGALRKREDVAFVFSCAIEVNANGEEKRTMRPFTKSTCWPGKEFQKVLVQGNVVPVMTGLFNRSMIEADKAGLWGNVNAEAARDWLFWLRACSYGDVCFVGKVTAYSREHEGNYTKTSLYTGKEFIAQYAIIEKIFKEVALSEDLKHRALLVLKGRAIKEVARQRLTSKESIDNNHPLVKAIANLFKLSRLDSLLISIIGKSKLMARLFIASSRLIKGIL